MTSSGGKFEFYSPQFSWNFWKLMFMQSTRKKNLQNASYGKARRFVFIFFVCPIVVVGQLTFCLTFLVIFALHFGPDFCGGAILKYYFSFVTFLLQKSWPSRFKILGDHDLKVKPYFVALCGYTALQQSGLYLSLKKVWHFHIVQNFSQNN